MVRRGRDIGEAHCQRLKIQTCATDDDRTDVLLQQLCHLSQPVTDGIGLITGNVPIQAVWGQCLFLGRWAGCQNTPVGINLQRIRIDNNATLRLSDT